MNGKPKLFISHASTEDALSKRVIDTLSARLGGKFEILLDQTNLEGGEPWREELWDWWSQCDLAVVVCSQAALRSRWVLIEVGVLMRRRSMNPNFPILPLMIDPVTDATIKSPADSLLHDQHLTELQGISIGEANFGAKLDEIEQRLAPFQVLDRRGKPLVEWEVHLATVLEAANDPEVLRDVAARLGRKADAWLGLRLQARIVARAMLEQPKREVFLEAVKPLRPRLMQRVKEVVDYVVPWWIAAEDVAPLSDVVTRPRNSRGVALATSWIPFAQWCIQRAACRYPPREAIVVDKPKTGTADEIVEIIVDGVHELLDLGFGASEAMIERIIKQREDDRDPIFAVVPISTKPNPKRAVHAELLPEIIEKVNAELEGIAFFVLAGQPPIEVQARTAGKVVLIPHDIEKETSLGVDYSNAVTG